jgi:hypothetical protein
MSSALVSIAPIGSFSIDRDCCVNRNVTNQGKNSRFYLEFPGAMQTTNSSKMSIGSVKIPYSWFNITEARQNNHITLNVPFGTTTSFALTLPDGYYDIPTLNAYFQSVMIANGMYLVNNVTGENVYFGSLEINLSRYRLQFNSYPFPYASSAAALAAGYTSGSGINYTGAAQNGVSWTVPANLYSFFGIVSSATTYTLPAVSTSVATSELPTMAPDYLVNQVILVHCSLVNNVRNSVNFRNSRNELIGHGANTVVAAIQITGAFGTDIHGDQFTTTWIPVQQGLFKEARFWLTNRNLQDLVLEDDSVVIEFLITQTST